MAHPSKELQVLLDGQRVKEDVVLRTQTQALTHFVETAANVVAANQSVAGCRLEETWQQ